MALTSDGKITAWGAYNHALNHVPASLDDKTVAAIEAGQYSNMALTSDGKITAWGTNYEGQNDVPASLDDKTVTAIEAGQYSNMALTSDGKVTSGEQMTRASWTSRSVLPTRRSPRSRPATRTRSRSSVTARGGLGVYLGERQQRPQDLADVTQIAAGYYHSLAIVGGSIASSFTTGVTATITGGPTVGSTLTAGEGDVAPAADS